LGERWERISVPEMKPLVQPADDSCDATEDDDAFRQQA
jgi:hypothetical protein